jgi:zinc protease
VQVAGPDDTTTAIIKELVEGKAQLFVTSGHATQKDWMIGFSYRNGFFVSQPDGKLAGKDMANKLHDISSDEPRLHLAVGNCLIGDISDTDNCMALGLMHSAGVRQMVGYTVTTWYGYMGWGLLDYFYLQPGRYTAAEAFFANQQALLHRLEKEPNLSAQDRRGLLYDRDTVAIYGDPAWNVRMAEGPNEWSQTIAETREGEKITYTITLRKVAAENTDKNGAQRGGRPFVMILPVRLDGSTKVDIAKGAELNPLIADDFVLIPKFAMEDGKDYTVMFSGTVRPIK